MPTFQLRRGSEPPFTRGRMRTYLVSACFNYEGVPNPFAREGVRLQRRRPGAVSTTKGIEPPSRDSSSSCLSPCKGFNYEGGTDPLHARRVPVVSVSASSCFNYEGFGTPSRPPAPENRGRRCRCFNYEGVRPLPARRSGGGTSAGPRFNYEGGRNPFPRCGRTPIG